MAAGKLGYHRPGGARFQRLRLVGDAQQRSDFAGPLQADAGAATRGVGEGRHIRAAKAQHCQQHQAHQT